MKSNLPLEITSKQEVISFFEELAKNGELFHPDDSVDDIFTQDNKRMFNDEEVELIESLITQCQAFYEDICEPAYNAMIKYQNINLSLSALEDDEDEEND